jgi:fibronectin-binding autotransporter adhesin
VQPGTPVALTLLAVPNTDVHVTTGLVPQKSIGQLREWTAPALSRLSPAMRFGPVLRDTGTTRLPFPGDIRGTWTWHRRPDPQSWASDPVVHATADALLPSGLPQASDGWLQVTLLPDNLYRDTATRIGISSVRTGRGPHGSRGAILAVGAADPDGGHSLLTVAEAARLQESGRFAFHVAPTGAEVHVITDASGVKSLSTSTNPSDPNGLAALPEAVGTVDRLAPASGTQGASVHLILQGEGLAGVTDLTFTDPGIEVTSMVAGDTWVDVAVSIDADVVPGPQALTLSTAAGTVDTARVSFEVVAAGTGVTRWTAGTRSTNWSDARNWSAGVPVESSIVIVDSAATIFAPAGTVRLRGLILDSTANVTFTSLATSVLELHGQAVLTAPTATVADAFTWTGGGYSGTLQLSSRSATRIEGPDGKQLLSGQLLLHGAVTWAGGGALTVSAPLVIDGLLVVEGTASFAGSTQVRNFGTVAVGPGASLSFDGARLENSGTLALSGGSVRFQRDQHTWHDGGAFAGIGSVQVNGSATIFTDGRLTVDPGVSIQLASGSMNGNLVVEGGGTLHWTGGTIASEPLELRPGCPTVVDGTATKTVTGRLLVRDRMTWTAGTLQLNGTGLVVEGRLDVQGTAACTGTGTLLNSGTIALASGGALTFTGPAFDHFGVLDLAGGTVDLQQNSHHWRDRSQLTGSGTVQVHAPATLVGEGHVVAGPGVGVQLVTGTLTGPFVVEGGATLTWLGGTIGSGSVELRPGCPFVIDGAATKTLSATLTVHDATTLGGSGTLQLNGTLVNEGRISVQATTPLTGTGALTNSGTMSLGTGVNLTTTGPAINHAGTIELAGGTVDLQGGSHTFASGCQLTGTGTVQVHSPASLTTGTANAAATVAPGVTVQLVSGAINAPFVVQGGGTLAWLGGTIGSTGTVETRADCPVLVDGAAARTLGANLILRGTTTWRGGGAVQVGGALVNQGTLRLQDSTQLTGAGTVRNLGTVALDPAVGLTLAGPVLDNVGTVQLSGGILTLQASANANANHALRDRTVLGGTGTVALTGGTVAADGRVSVAAGVEVRLAGATLNGTFAFDGGGTFTWTGGTIGATMDARSECPFVIDGTAAKSLSGGVVVRGAATWQGGGGLQLTGTLTSEGTLTITASAQCSGAGTLTNKGSLVLPDAVTLTMAGTGLTQAGVLSLAGGTVNLQNGAHHLNEGSRLTGTGTVQLHSPGTLSADTHLAVAPGVTVQVVDGTLAGTAAIEGGGTLVWSGGTLNGTFDVRPDCPVVINGTATKTVTGTLVLRGATTWSDGGTLQVTSALVNEGTLTVQTSAQVTGSNTVTNRGTIALADGVNLTLPGSVLEHFGTVHLSGGALNLPGHQHNWHEGAALTGAGQLSLTGSGRLTVEPGVGIVLNAATLSTLPGGASIEGGGTVQVIAGTLGGNGLEVRSDCVVVIDGTATKTVSGTVILRGSTTWSEGGILQINSTLVNEGTFTVADDVQSTGTGTFVNKGTIAIGDGVDLAMNGPALDHSGTIALAGGSIDLQKSGTHSWRTGAALTGTGTLQVHSPAAVAAGGHLSVEPGVTVQLVSGAVSGTLTFEGGGSFTWLGGSLGAAEFRTGCPVLFDGSATKTLTDTVVLRGHTVWTGGGTLAVNGRVLVNAGRLEIQASAQCSGSGTVNCQGTIALSPGVGWTLSGPLLSNTGTLELGTGTLSLGTGAHTLSGRSGVDVDLVSTDVFGHIASTGTVNLAGTLVVNPTTTGPFTVVTAQSVQGTFTEVDSTEASWTAAYTATTVTVQPTPQLHPAARGLTVFDLAGRYLPTPSPVISVNGTAITVDMSALGRPTATGTVLDASTIRVTFPDTGTLTGQLLPDPDRIMWSNNSVWTKV